MATLLLKVELNDVLDLIRQLSPEEKRMIRQQLEDEEFRQALAAVHARMPANVPEEEIDADIEQAIREVRENKP